MEISSSSASSSSSLFIEHNLHKMIATFTYIYHTCYSCILKKERKRKKGKKTILFILLVHKQYILICSGIFWVPLSRVLHHNIDL